tara:strand:- start:118 stop:453 length:336 start_codon:yes stop_codon:yes gene_type:complete
MNAAAKTIHQSNIFSGQFGDVRISKSLLLQLILLVSVLLSAITVIYATNGYRSTFSQVQNAKHVMNEHQLRWGQLLLEQASLETPARIEAIAKSKFYMRLPVAINTQVIRL